MTPRSYKILVIDDQIGKEGPFRNSFLDSTNQVSSDFLFSTGQDESGHNCVDTVIDCVDSLWPDGTSTRLSMILLDVRFDDAQDREAARFGFTLLRALRETFGRVLPIVMLTTEENAREVANEYMADGFLPKSDLTADTLSAQLFRNGVLPDSTLNLIGTSLSFLLTLREMRRVLAKGSTELLLLGETGTGKSELAKYSHIVSSRREGPLRSWFARGVNAELHYDQLFGHWKGAFNGAEQNAAGVAEQAHGGTLFIDEIAELSPQSQTELLEYRTRHNADGLRRIRRLGLYPKSAAKDLNLIGTYSSEEDRILVDCNLIAATNQPISDPEWRERLSFRNDIYSRLGNRFEIPPLRERQEDIVPLFLFFTQVSVGRNILLSRGAKERLEAHNWSEGNIAELKIAAETATARLGPDFDELHVHHLNGILADPHRARQLGIHPPIDSGGEYAKHIKKGQNNDAAPERFVDFEVQSLWGLAERIRTSVVETRRPTGLGSLADILKHATGVQYEPTDVKREVKEILGVWFAPNERQTARWRTLAKYNDLARVVKSDAVLSSLYRYSTGEITWNEAKTSIVRILEEPPTGSARNNQ
ncbi:MAG: sigma-54-dependent transcriptional regulator [Candidatus Acidiferrales bacterium]